MPAKYSQYDDPKKPPRIALTGDDKQILLEAFRHDVMDVQITRILLPHRSEDTVGRRLNKMRKTKHLIRLRQREEKRREGGGSFPKAYALGQKGYDVVKSEFELPPKKAKYNERTKRITAETIEHALEQARMLVAIRQSIEAQPPLEFLYPEQIYKRFEPEILKRRTLPREVKARVNLHGYRELERTIPDGIFMIINPDNPVGQQRRSIFLEIDRGTMTIDPSDAKLSTLTFWKDSSMLRKFLVYEFAARTNSHKM